MRIKIIPYRRKREGKTNYKKRFRMLLSKNPRAVVRKSLLNIEIQIIEFDPKGDKVIASAHSKDLAKQGWKASTSSIPAAYLTGLMLAKNTKVKVANLDIGLQRSIKGSKLFAAAKGMVDGGLQINIDESMFPSEDRIKGKHIADYAKSLKDKEAYKKQFSQYIKNKVDPADIEKQFESVKKKIMG